MNNMELSRDHKSGQTASDDIQMALHGLAVLIVHDSLRKGGEDSGNAHQGESTKIAGRSKLSIRALAMFDTYYRVRPTSVCLELLAVCGYYCLPVLHSYLDKNYPGGSESYLPQLHSICNELTASAQANAE